MGFYALFCVVGLAGCLSAYLAYRAAAGRGETRRRGAVEYTVRVWGEWPQAPEVDRLHPRRVEMEFRVELEGETPAAQRAARSRSALQAMAEFRRLCRPLGEALQVGAVRFAPVDDDNAQRDTL